MTLDTYRALLAESGPMKLRGKALLAYGDDESRFEAAVLFHEAVRIEDRAFALLENPPAVTALRHAIERFACLLEGLDPLDAGPAWQAVAQAAGAVEKTTRDAMLEQAKPRWIAARDAFLDAMKRAPTLFPARGVGLAQGSADAPTFAEQRVDGAWRSMALPVLDPLTWAEQRVELAPLLRQYPGVAHFWFRRSYLEHVAGNTAGAWEAVRRAVRLQPSDANYQAIHFWMAPQMLSREDLERELAGHDLGGVPLRIGLMLGSVEAAAKAKTEDDRIRHLRLVDELLALPRPEGTSDQQRRLMRAAELLARDVREGRPPSERALQRTGFGKLVSIKGAAAKPSPTYQLLTTMVSELAEAA